MAGLIEATALTSTGEGLAAQLDPAWDIWGPAGGYVAAIALRAVGHVAPLGHRPVTLTGQFVRAVKPGTLDVRVDVVKPGSTMLFAVTLAQGGQPVFLAQLWTTARHDDCLPISPQMPDVHPPEQVRALRDICAERGITEIEFWKNLDGRPLDFRQWSDPPSPETHQYRWMRFREWEPTSDPFLDAMRSIVLIDIGVWPAHWHRLTEAATYVAPSLDIAVHFHGGLPAGQWLLSDADSDVAACGTISGRVRVWSEDGRAIATGSGHCLVIAAKT